MPLQLVSSPIAPDLARCVSDLGDGVHSGEITGLAVIVALRGRRFFVDVFGTVAKNPVEARGQLLELDDCLREIVRRQRDTNTTRT